MGVIKTTGIVIAENNMGDFDKMVTVLTPNMGKISCAAKGSRRPKSTIMAGTQLLCFAEFIIYKGNNSYNINSAEPIEMFYNLRIDYEKLQYVAHITKIIQDVTDENQNTYRILQLYLNTLYVLSETDKNIDLSISIFKIRLLTILGFKPQIDDCAFCGNKEEICAFSFKDDGFKCKECAKQDTGAISLSKTAIDAIRYVCKAPAKKIFSFDLKEEDIKQIKLVADIYLNQKLDTEYKMENLYKI